MRTALLSILLTFGSGVLLFAFDFYDAGGRRYRSTHLTEDIQRYYGFRHSPILVLVETPSLSQPDYKRQMAILDSLDAEQLGLLYVVASRADVDQHSYHTSRKVAIQLARSHESFRATLFSHRGALLRTSNRPFTPADIEAIVRSHNQKSRPSKSPNQQPGVR